jgi:hypothetical protein
MRSSLVVRASDCQCTSCNGPGFDPSICRHSGIWGAADEAVLNIVRKKKYIWIVLFLVPQLSSYCYLRPKDFFLSTLLQRCWSYTESIATLPPFGPVEEHQWFFQISSQWESQKNWFAFISLAKSSFYLSGQFQSYNFDNFMRRLVFARA